MRGEEEEGLGPGGAGGAQRHGSARGPWSRSPQEGAQIDCSPGTPVLQNRGTPAPIGPLHPRLCPCPPCLTEFWRGGGCGLNQQVPLRPARPKLPAGRVSAGVLDITSHSSPVPLYRQEVSWFEQEAVLTGRKCEDAEGDGQAIRPMLGVSCPMLFGSWMSCDLARNAGGEATATVDQPVCCPASNYCQPAHTLSLLNKSTDYKNYYQGMWDCTGDHPDELSFKRGDAIYILSKVGVEKSVKSRPTDPIAHQFPHTSLKSVGPQTRHHHLHTERGGRKETAHPHWETSEQVAVRPDRSSALTHIVKAYSMDQRTEVWAVCVLKCCRGGNTFSAPVPALSLFARILCTFHHVEVL
ncbi:hypothetical protein JZ751_009713 [Albula glossodonta]|uniref:SH3 domain-containing protein n=1 Tax=Albula glossodonta TaxID=121402 RepID=A0A8T2P0F3_9TELE|nr:hypothetical protein JZ751_009713 [Albula glossodonta]